MPKVVVLVASDDHARNLSDLAYAAFSDPGYSAHVSRVSGRRIAAAVRNVSSTLLGPRRAGLDNDEVEAREPFVRTVHNTGRRPTNVTIKEHLDGAHVEEMLHSTADWSVAIPKGSTTDVLDKEMLAEAWETNATGRVTMALREATAEEQSLLDDGKKRLSPEAGLARMTTSLGAPIANIGLIAAVVAFLSLKGGDAIERDSLVAVAAVCLILSLIVSLVANAFFKTKSVRLSRLDLLRSGSRSLGPPSWLPTVCAVLFAASLVAAFFSVFPSASSSGTPTASIGKPATVQSGSETKATFIVKWSDLSSDAANIRTTTTSPAGTPQTDKRSKDSDGTATQQIEYTVPRPTAVTVTTQALGTGNKAVGDQIAHTYDVP